MAILQYQSEQSSHGMAIINRNDQIPFFSKKITDSESRFIRMNEWFKPIKFNMVIMTMILYDFYSTY